MASGDKAHTHTHRHAPADTHSSNPGPSLWISNQSSCTFESNTSTDGFEKEKKRDELVSNSPLTVVNSERERKKVTYICLKWIAVVDIHQLTRSRGRCHRLTSQIYCVILTCLCKWTLTKFKWTEGLRDSYCYSTCTQIFRSLCSCFLPLLWNRQYSDEAVDYSTVVHAAVCVLRRL